LNTSEKSEAKKPWIVFVNPNAGTKKGRKDWPEISALLKASGLPFKDIRTEHRDHAVALTMEQAKKGFRKFIVVGGDGTLNEVVNGIFRQSEVPPESFLVAMIPVGTGNDWCRMFNVPFKYKNAVQLIKKEQVFVQDVGRVTYFDGDQEKHRYFVNVAGMGYDAIVAAKTNKDKARGRGGPLVYIKNLISSLLFYNHSRTSITIDDRPAPVEHLTFSVSVGIGKYNGGGMMQLPDAIPDDGILNMTLIKKLGKFTVLKEVRHLYDGSFIHHPKVETFVGKSIQIQSDPTITLEADGESLGHSPFEFTVLPKRLSIVAGMNVPSQSTVQ
jgi:YegS/Rv2252/BmrU family lipid kinase